MPPEGLAAATQIADDLVSVLRLAMLYHPSHPRFVAAAESVIAAIDPMLELELLQGTLLLNGGKLADGTGPRVWSDRFKELGIARIRISTGATAENLHALALKLQQWRGALRSGSKLVTFDDAPPNVVVEARKYGSPFGGLGATAADEVHMLTVVDPSLKDVAQAELPAPIRTRCEELVRNIYISIVERFAVPTGPGVYRTGAARPLEEVLGLANRAIRTALRDLSDSGDPEAELRSIFESVTRAVMLAQLEPKPEQVAQLLSHALEPAPVGRLFSEDAWLEAEVPGLDRGRSDDEFLSVLKDAVRSVPPPRFEADDRSESISILLHLLVRSRSLRDRTRLTQRLRRLLKGNLQSAEECAVRSFLGDLHSSHDRTAVDDALPVLALAMSESVPSLAELLCGAVAIRTSEDELELFWPHLVIEFLCAASTRRAQFHRPLWSAITALSHDRVASAVERLGDELLPPARGAPGGGLRPAAARAAAGVRAAAADEPRGRCRPMAPGRAAREDPLVGGGRGAAVVHDRDAAVPRAPDRALRSAFAREAVARDVASVRRGAHPEVLRGSRGAATRPRAAAHARVPRRVPHARDRRRPAPRPAPAPARRVSGVAPLLPADGARRARVAAVPGPLMTAPIAPSQNGIDETSTSEQVVSYLIHGLRYATFYFREHPRVREMTEQFAAAIEHWTAPRNRDCFFLGMAEKRLVHEGRLLMGSTLHGRCLVDLAVRLKSGGFLFRRGLKACDVDEFLRFSVETRGKTVTLEEARSLLESRTRFVELSPPYDEETWFGRSANEGQVSWLQGSKEAGDSPQVVAAYQSLFDTVDESHGLAANGRDVNVAKARGTAEALVNLGASGMGDVLGLAKYSDFDSYTVGHSARVSLFAALVGLKLKLPHELMVELGTAGLLHDVGKSRIAHEILFKPGPLNEDERRAVSRHPQLGAQILVESHEASDLAIGAAFGHHLRFDGGGYPTRASWLAASKVSALVHVCDVFEALTAVRPYKPSLTPRRAYEIMLRDAGSFDRESFAAFVASIGLHPPGSVARLSSGEVGVVQAAGSDWARPVVRITHGSDGSRRAREEQLVLDLSSPENAAISVAETLPAAPLVAT